MAVRVGTGLVRVDTVRDALASHGERYLQRVYTDGERTDCAGAGGVPDPLRLAARFAAKEAAMKALRVGDRAVGWQAIEVTRHAEGYPEIRLHGAAADLAAAAGITDLAVSLSHEDVYASAVVIAEVGHPPASGPPSITDNRNVCPPQSARS